LETAKVKNIIDLSKDNFLRFELEIKGILFNIYKF